MTHHNICLRAFAGITGVEKRSNREREAASLCVSLSLFGGWVLIGGNLHNFMARSLPCHDRDAVFGHAKMPSQNFNERLVGCPVHRLSAQKYGQAIWRGFYEVTLFGIRFDENGDFHTDDLWSHSLQKKVNLCNPIAVACYVYAFCVRWRFGWTSGGFDYRLGVQYSDSCSSLLRRLHLRVARWRAE